MAIQSGLLCGTALVAERKFAQPFGSCWLTSCSPQVDVNISKLLTASVSTVEDPEIRSSETSIIFYQTTGRHFADDGEFHETQSSPRA